MGMDPLTVGLIATAVVGGYSAYSANQNAQRQNDAQQQALRQAKAQAAEADQANNRANQKKADTTGILAQMQQAGKAGSSGTMLTGAGGVNPSGLNLGGNTLLGQ
jgi:ATPase subunit of ABC transporter with duplicated ATPase domains